ncbi:MAG: hypothetical protein Q8L64_06160 [bacterium]|nr:hypothetical protein [bacterium]
MNTPVQSPEVKTNNITLSSVFAWLFGIIFIILGLTNIGKWPVSGILFFIVAALCLPPVTKLLKERANLTFSKGVKILVVLIVMVIGFSLVGSKAAKQVETKAVVEAVAPVPEPVPTIKVTADQLMNEYNANEISAEAKYKGKVIQVSGTVESIGKDIVGSAYIALRTGGEYSISSVQCMFPKSAESALAQVSKEERIVLEGQVSGKLGNVIVRSCKII